MENLQPLIEQAFENRASLNPKSAPPGVVSAVVAKFKSKDSVDAAFGFSNDEPQGICADVQQEVYDTVLNDVLSEQERDTYLSQGKQLFFIRDDDVPPLDNTTNPVRVGSLWLTVDPATKVTTDGTRYYYEPWSLYVAYDDPDITDQRLKGVRYCKLLSHQAILSWMLEKSFEENPVLITPTSSVCDKPSALESPTNGSCLLYFALANNYYLYGFYRSRLHPGKLAGKM